MFSTKPDFEIEFTSDSNKIFLTLKIQDEGFVMLGHRQPGEFTRDLNFLITFDIKLQSYLKEKGFPFEKICDDVGNSSNLDKCKVKYQIDLGKLELAEIKKLADATNTYFNERNKDNNPDIAPNANPGLTKKLNSNKPNQSTELKISAKGAHLIPKLKEMLRATITIDAVENYTPQKKGTPPSPSPNRNE